MVSERVTTDNNSLNTSKGTIAKGTIAGEEEEEIPNNEHSQDKTNAEMMMKGMRTTMDGEWGDDDMQEEEDVLREESLEDVGGFYNGKVVLSGRSMSPTPPTPSVKEIETSNVTTLQEKVSIHKMIDGPNSDESIVGEPEMVVASHKGKVAEVSVANHTMEDGVDPGLSSSENHSLPNRRVIMELPLEEMRQSQFKEEKERMIGFNPEWKVKLADIVISTRKGGKTQMKKKLMNAATAPVRAGLITNRSNTPSN